MKTPREHWNDLILARSLAVETIEARDAEWRRLVEEAQGELAIANEALQGDLVEYRALAAERDRLKGELAEARRLNDATESWANRRPIAMPKAATPAEQAQPSTEAEKRCVRPDCGRLESCHDVPFAAANHDFDAAEQAQGEAAPPIDEEHRDIRSAMTKTACRIDDRVDALAKRVDALTNLVTSLARDSATQGAMVEVQNKVAALEAERPGKGWVGHYCDQPTACPHRMTPPAPPPPEAAGPMVFSTPVPMDPPIPLLSREEMRNARERINPTPRMPEEAAGHGHAFVKPRQFAVFGMDAEERAKVGCGQCGVLEADHAVPPIPEGK